MSQDTASGQLSVKEVVQTLKSAGIVVANTAILGDVKQKYPQFREWVIALGQKEGREYQPAVASARKAIDLTCLERTGISLKTDELLRTARQYDPDFNAWMTILSDPDHAQYTQARDYVKTILGTIAGSTRETLDKKLGLRPSVQVLIAIAKQEGESFRVSVSAIAQDRPEAQECVAWVRQIVQSVAETVLPVDTMGAPSQTDNGAQPADATRPAPPAASNTHSSRAQAASAKHGNSASPPRNGDSNQTQRQRSTPAMGQRGASEPSQGASAGTRSSAPVVGPGDYETGSGNEYGRSFHVYNVGNAALMVREDVTRPPRNDHTIALEIAKSLSRENRTFNWKEKIIIQLTVKEMISLHALLIGKIKALRIIGHGPLKDKGMEAKQQEDSFFISIFNKEGGRGVKVLASDTFPMIDIIMGQMKKNYPNLNVEMIIAQMDNVVGPMLQAEAAKRPAQPRRA